MAPENNEYFANNPDMVLGLQWGRGRMAPENKLVFRSEPVRLWGLLQWGRGRMAPENIAMAIRETAYIGRLQWGRGRMAPENISGRRRLFKALKLQWGRGRMAPENADMTSTGVTIG